jgi:hypothetical protein
MKPSDTAHKFDPKAYNHVVFIRKNKFFSVPLVNSKGKELSAAELEVYVFCTLRKEAALKIILHSQADREGHQACRREQGCADWGIDW